MYYQVKFYDIANDEERSITDADNFDLSDAALVVYRGSRTWIHPLHSIRDVSVHKTSGQVKP